MKIAIIAPEVFPVPPIRGGAVETEIEESSRHVPSHHQVHILGIADPELPLRQTRGSRTYLRYRPSWIDRLLLCSWKLPFKRSASRWYYWPYSRWVARQIKQLQPDVIRVHSRMHVVPWLRAAAPRAQVILSIHNESNLEGDAVWSPRAIAACDLITACSRSMADMVLARRPACAGKVQVLRNGVNLEAFAPRWSRQQERQQARRSLGVADGPVVLYVGRLVEPKGVHVLIEAFQRAAQQLPEAHLVIAGAHTFSDPRKTAYIERLRRMAQGWEDRMHFVGHVPHGRVAAYFLASDVVAVPSLWAEPFGLVVVEAMATGVPVVAFHRGGPAEIIRDGKDGLLVAPEQGAEGFAEALGRCLGDPTLREVLGREARWTAEERFGWQGVARQLLDLCDTFIQNPKPKIQNVEIPARVLIAESGTGYGGSAKYLSELAAVLDRRRYELCVAAAQISPFIEQVRAQGIPVFTVGAWKFPWWDPAPGRGLRGLSWVRFGASAVAQLTIMVPRIAWWLRRRRIQLVHLNNEILSHLPLLLAARLAGCRVVCHLHGWRPFTKIERLAARAVDQFVCISETGAQYYREQLRAHDVMPIPNGIKLNGQLAHRDEQRRRQREALRLGDADIAVASPGRLVAWKGHDVFLRALADAVREDPRIMGIIQGQDPSNDQGWLAQLQALTRQLGLESRVRFLPWQADVWPLYAAADVIVHAATQPEPFGLVILEAMAAGKPVIATRAGGVLDLVIDGQTGLLVSPGDDAALSQAIRRLCAEPGLARRISRQGEQRVRAWFTIERNAAQLCGVYDRLLRASQER